jgi:hypothetical protein
MTAPVRLNVYDLINSETKTREIGKDILERIGMGIYHTGVEVYGEEYSFGMDPTGLRNPNTQGIFAVEPHTADGVYKQTIQLGFTSKSKAEILSIVESLKPQWMAASYHLLDRNCCHFTKAFAAAIDPAFADAYPAWANRAAGVGSAVVPEALLRSLTELLAPPPSIPSELINKVHQKWTAGPAPRPIPPWTEIDPSKMTPPPEDLVAPDAAKPPGAPSASSSSLLGRGLSLAGRVASTVITHSTNIASAVKGRIVRYIDESDREEFSRVFPQLDASLLLSAYSCHVIHIHRVQRAKLFITEKEIALHGPSKLAHIMPFSVIGSCQYGAVVPPPPDQKMLPPAFQLIGSDGNGMPSAAAGLPSALLFFDVTGSSFTPVFDLSFIGALGKIGSHKHSTVVSAMKYCDMGWRSVHQN